MSAPTSRRRLRRWLVVIGLVVVLLLGIAYGVLRVKFEGADLGETVASLLNKRMRGRVAIGSIEWEPSALKTVITGGWVPVTVRDVKVWDDCALNTGSIDPDVLRTSDPSVDCTPDERPDTTPGSTRKPRKLLARVPLITAEIDIHALLFGHHDFVFRKVVIHGGEALIEETREPYPLHAYDRVIVSIVTAFYPRMKAGFRMGIYADAPPPVFDIRDIHIRDLDLTVHMKPYSIANKPDHVGYGFTAHLQKVNVDADASSAEPSFLYMNATDPLVAKFYLRLVAQAASGLVRIRDEGPRTAFRLPLAGEALAPEARVWPPQERTADYALNLAEIQLDRLAQLPSEWSRHDFVANTLEIDLHAKTLPCSRPGEPVSVDATTMADLHLFGELHNYWDRPYDGQWNLQLATKNLGHTVRSCIKSNIGGENLAGTITLTGPFVASPRIGLEMTNLDFDLALKRDEAPVQLTLAEVHGAIDLVNEQGFIDKTVALIQGGKEPGEVALSATFGLKPLNANAQIEIAKPIDVGRFLPPKIATKVGKFLKGRLRARGDVEEGFALEDFDLSLAPDETSSVLRVHKGRLFTDDDFDTIHVENVYVNARRSHASFDGSIDVLHKDLDLRIEGHFPDLGQWLKLFDLPAFVQSAGGGSVIILKGPISQPRINVTTELAGVPCIDTLRLVDTQYSDGVVEIRKMTTAGLGGELTGSGRVRIGTGAPYIERLALAGKRIEAGKLCGLKGKLKGTLDTVELELARATVDKRRTPLDWMDYAKVLAKAPKLSVLGDPYSNVSLCLNRPDDSLCRPAARAMYVTDADIQKCTEAKRTGGACVVATATRDRGGVVDATVAKLPPASKVKGASPRLGGAVSIDLPLHIVDAVIGPILGAPFIGGAARTTLHLGGTTAAPVADGHMTLLRSWIAQTFVGDSQLRVEPITLPGGKAGIQITGKALSDRLTIRGTLGTTAPYPVELSITARRVELDTMFDLTTLLRSPEPIQAWVSGTVTVRAELAKKPIEPEAWVELTEVMGIVNHRGADGRLVPLRLSVIDQQPGARAALSARLTPSTLELACKNPAAPGGREPCTTKIATPAGVIELRGHANASSVALQAHGMLDLALVAPLLDDRFDAASGTVKLSASVSGTFANPSYEAALDLDPDGLWAKEPAKANPIRVRPVGGDTFLEAPTGLIKIANGSLGFTDVLLQVRDEHLDEKGELHVKGNIKLDGLTPAGWSLLISGKLAGKMLLVAVPGFVSQASGLATIDGDLILSGTGTTPLVSGTLSFDPPADNPRLRSLSVIPRGVRREFQARGGTVDIETTVSADQKRTYTLAVNDVIASIDGEGSIKNLSGDIEVRDGEMTKLALRLDAEDYPFEIKNVVRLTLAASNVSITKTQFSELAVRGNISVVEGTYERDDINLTERIKTIGALKAPTKPFWEEYPLLGNAELGLTVDVRRFRVDNSFADIEMVGPLLEISGTPKEPHMSGSIRVERGEFRITGTRARFTQTSGSIDFSETRPISDPELSVTSIAPDFRDISGQEHAITLTITGPLSNFQFDLRTSTGYNKNQTLALLVLGRNQEQLRRSLGDQSLGSDPQNVDPTTNPNQSFADQVVKDLAGDYLSQQLGGTLEKYTRLDVLRIQFSFNSIGLHAEKKFFENVNLIGDVEQTLRGYTVNARGIARTPWARLNLEVGYLQKNFSDPAEQDISDASVKFVLPLILR